MDYVISVEISPAALCGDVQTRDQHNQRG